MTCAEAILSDLPLITSAACPALEYLASASCEVRADDVEGYARAIEGLKDSPLLYERMQTACLGLKQQFFHYDRSWDRAMRMALSHLIELPVSAGSNLKEIIPDSPASQ
jgi:hypothetical protein